MLLIMIQCIYNGCYRLKDFSQLAENN